jgi:hypothetical protein
MSDTPTLVRFYTGYHETGATSESGLPAYRKAIMVRLDRPPTLSVVREAEENDIETHHEAFRMYEKEERSRSGKDLPEGYPLSLWPVINEFYLKVLAQRDIYTVEALAKLSKRKDIPPDFVELAVRAEEMIALMQGGIKWEAVVKDLKGQVEALKEQVEDCQKTIVAQKELIATLKKAA